MLKLLSSATLLAATSLWAAPNLVIKDLRFAEDPAKELDRITFRATLTNTGDTPTPSGVPHAVTFYRAGADGKLTQLTYGSNFRGPLPSGESIEVKAGVPWMSMEPGTFQFVAKADDVNRIPESAEEDNSIEQQIEILPNPEARKDIAANPIPAPLPASTLEAVPNGNFSERLPNGKPAGWKDQSFRDYGTALVVEVNAGQRFEWDARGKLIWDADYVFSYELKIDGAEAAGKSASGVRAVVWPRLPEQHEPVGGSILGPIVGVTQGWTHVEIPFRMPRGVSRFIVFFDRPKELQGRVLLTNLSLRPVNTRDLTLPNTNLLGKSDLEQMLWIWKKPGFHGGQRRDVDTTTLVFGAHMGNVMREDAPKESAWFRRKFTLPEKSQNAQAVFAGDDKAELVIDGVSHDSNIVWQDIRRVPLPKLTAGEHEVILKVSNAMGSGGALGRLEWTSANGKREAIPTNGNWEVSEDEGRSWRPASEVAPPAPALAAYHWAYPHLPLQSYRLSYALPRGTTAARFVGLSPNGYRLMADETILGDFECAGQPVRVNLGEALKGKQQLTVEFQEVGLQPPAGNGLLELEVDGEIKTVPVEKFATETGSAPSAAANHFQSDLTWPISQIAFEAAATRPIVPDKYERESWVDQLVEGAKVIWQIGNPDGSSAEFATPETAQFEVSSQTPAAKVTRELELKKHPSLQINFDLPVIPPNGAALVADIEDADALVSQCGVFVNGAMTGLLHLSGPDQLPGHRLTRRAWAVTIEPERLHAGQNTVELRMLEPYYAASGKTSGNQSEEYIRQLNLGNRADNPHPSNTWLQLDAIGLYALAKSPPNPVNGRPATLGTNSSSYYRKGSAEWPWILRDLQYIGLTGIQAPIRFGMWDDGFLREYNKTESNGETRGDYIFRSLLELGMRPLVNFEPGRGLRTPAEIADSSGAKAIRTYGKYFDMLETGNEVDHPYYGFDKFTLAMASATIQKSSTVGRELVKLVPDKKMRTTGQGWYQAWDFSTIDAHARQETPQDPGYTDTLAAHCYALSYIIPISLYYNLYGPTFGNSEIWITECGGSSNSPDDAGPLDVNFRGDLSYGSHIVQYIVHPHGPDHHLKMCLLSNLTPDATINERARCYRRYVLGYGLKGASLPWQPLQGTLKDNEQVLVRVVDAGKWWKIALVSFEHRPIHAAIRVTLPKAGTYSAKRFGDGKTVKEATREISLTATPAIDLDENLQPGESVEYLIEK